MQLLGQDIRYAIKGLLAKPGFSLTAILALTLGIGANTAIFSVVHAVLLRALPYENPDQLVWIWENNSASNIKEEPVSYPDFADHRSQSQSFQDLAAFSGWVSILTRSGEPERIPGALVSPGLFQMLGAQPEQGRSFLPDEDTAGKNRVVMLSHGLWQRRFGSDREIVGKTIILNQNPYQVIGIMPSSFQFPNPGNPKSAEVWAPLPSTLISSGRRSDFLSVIGRLNPKTSIAQASSELGIIASRLENQYPETNAGWGITIIPLHQRFTGDVRTAMLVLAISVALLLLIACTNLANLLLVRATARSREIAIRKALGATQNRLMQQFLTESCLLGLFGGAAGILAAPLGVKGLVLISPSAIPRIDKASIDLQVLAFALVLSAVTGLIFGIFPAIHASRMDFNEVLREGGRSSSAGVSGGRIRAILLISEVALVLSLLIGSALMIKSFRRLQTVNLGFDPERLLTLELGLPRQKYKEPYQIAEFIGEVIRKVGSLPGVEAVASSSVIPLSGNLSVLDFEIAGRPPLPPGQVNDAESQAVSPSYFQAIGVPLMRGRLFTDLDNKDSTPVMIISEAMAKRYFPDEDPIGKRVTLEDTKAGQWFTIVGIVGNVRQSAVNLEPYPQMYTMYAQNPGLASALIVKATSDPRRLVEYIREQVASVDSEQPLYNVRTMADVVSTSLSRQRFSTALVGILTAAAFLLTTVGIYGVVSYIVAQRFNEIGIRIAMGAQKSQIIKIVLWQGLKLGLIGIAFGLGAALVLTQLMSSLLYGTSPTDPSAFVGIPLLLAVVIVLASSIPALKAVSIDPVAALRYE
jgi:putative ABC transport system permease protein